jgi:N6-L-threonylcarbamoyladenine synthase
MIILGIETSCDETAVCLMEANGDISDPAFRVLGNALYSQVKIHAEYGGVFPAVAKREHAKNLVPLFKKALEDAGMLAGKEPNEADLSDELKATIQKRLEREPGLADALLGLAALMEKPAIDIISVTAGPGLEPALWVGINFALALGELWNIPVIPANHMEGHILSPLFHSNISNPVAFPALALLISGGHTELVLIKGWTEYEVIGQTRDDAVGEAFDKVARLLSLPYPGGPQISKLAAGARIAHTTPRFNLPRPMLKSGDYDFSFSGIKTSVLYALKKLPAIEDAEKKEMALEFEDAVTEVLVAKTRTALESYEIKTLILGGGVIANTFIREAFKKLAQEFHGMRLLIPDLDLSTDNAVMIAIAGYFDVLSGKKPQTEIKAEGNMQL